MIEVTTVVLGLGWGDEGKGIATDFMCKDKGFKFVVVRFNGGHQAGHTVNDGKYQHVFSNFGSGTLSGAETFWSDFCTVEPVATVNEYEALVANGYNPKLTVDPMCPVVTPYDVLYNQILERRRVHRHGSCGMGFGTTIERNEGPYKLFAMDLTNKFVLANKMQAIKEYYLHKIKLSEEREFKEASLAAIQEFIECIPKYLDIVTLTPEAGYFSDLEDSSEHVQIVFEGAQGIMLDMDHGFFPHVTRSNTTSCNAMAICQDNFLDDPIICYVTRAYATRHGAGPFVSEVNMPTLKNHEGETNVFNEWQENFRRAPLDLSVMKYALMCDRNYSPGCIRYLFVTCLDQVDEVMVNKGTLTRAYAKHELGKLYNQLGFEEENVMESHSPITSNVVDLYYKNNEE